MKKINKNIVAALVLSLASSAVHAEDKAGMMNLNDVVQKALMSHPEYKQAEKLIDSAKEGVVQAKAGYLPKVELNLATGYERTENQSTINKHIASPYKSTDATLNRQEASLNVYQMLFDGFATPARVEKAKYNLENHVFYGKEIADKVALAATKAFYDVSLESKNLNIEENNLKMHRNYQSQIKRRVSSGKSNRADLEQVNSRVALAQAQLIQRQELLENAKAEFLRQTGMESGALMDNDLDFSLVPSSLNEAVQISHESNPRLRSLESSTKSSKSAIKEAKAAYMPRVDLDFGATRNQNVDGVDKKDHDESAMLRLHYNLYNGGADKAKHKASIAESEASMKQLEDAKREVTKNVRSAWYEYQLTSKRVTALNAQVRASKATKTAYKSQFDVGQRTLLDVLDSEREYNSAKTNYETARTERDFAVYQLLSYMGKVSELFEEKETVLAKNDVEETVEETLEEDVSTQNALEAIANSK